MSNFPFDDSPVVTAFGVGGWPGTGLRLDESGCVAPVAQTVRKVGMVASTAVMLRETPVAVLGMPVQRPLSPCADTVCTSPTPRGVAFGPTWNSGRVSRTRHGVIGTNVAASDGLVALTSPTAPEPSVTATAAPTAAQRERTIDMTKPLFVVLPGQPGRTRW